MIFATEVIEGAMTARGLKDVNGNPDSDFHQQRMHCPNTGEISFEKKLLLGLQRSKDLRGQQA